MSRNHAYGSFSVNFTVCLSSASTFSTDFRRYAFVLPVVVWKRVMEYATSSAVNSRAFTGGFGCHFTPFLSLKIHVVSVGCVHDSARSPTIGKVPGVTDAPARCFTSRLCVYVASVCSL